MTTFAASASPPPSAWVAALIEALPQFFADIEGNAPPPASLAVGDLADALDKINAMLPSAILILRAHKGVITGVAHMLDVLDHAGVPHVANLRAILLAIPGAMDKAEAVLPRVLWMLKTFAPAPTGLPGAWAGARGHI